MTVLFVSTIYNMIDKDNTILGSIIFLMQRHTIYCLVFVFSCIIISCDKDVFSHETDQRDFAFEVSSNHFVNIDQIRSYANRYQPQTKNTGLSNYSIQPYCDSTGTPLLYIVNYGNNKGWQILSSDTRTPPVLAQGGNGSFSLEDGNPAIRIWIDCMARDVSAIRKASDAELSFSSDDITSNKQVWSGGDRSLDDPFDFGGHWEVTTTSILHVDEEIEHLTPHWAQNYPYNVYCPFESNSTVNRAPTGCVAVAASEVLYYLHKRFGVPTSMVDTGICIGDVDSFNRYFSGESTTIWGQMDTLYNSVYANAEALMMGHVGDVVNMHYWHLFNYYFSWAIPDNIRDNLFSFYGISSSSGVYNASSVVNNLLNRMPVIISATDFALPVDGDIHCFVIDGFRRYHYEYQHYHYWVPDDPNNPEYILPLHEYDPYYTYSYSDAMINAIKINWGWESQWKYSVNDGWYALTPEWAVTINGASYNYNYNVNMIYDLAVTE